MGDGEFPLGGGGDVQKRLFYMRFSMGELQGMP